MKSEREREREREIERYRQTDREGGVTPEIHKSILLSRQVILPVIVPSGPFGRDEHKVQGTR